MAVHMYRSFSSCPMKKALGSTSWRLDSSGHRAKHVTSPKVAQYSAPTGGPFLLEMAPGVSITLDDTHISIQHGSNPQLHPDQLRSRDQQTPRSPPHSQHNTAIKHQQAAHQKAQLQKHSGHQFLSGSLPATQAATQEEEHQDLDEDNDFLQIDPFAPADPAAQLQAPEAQLIQQRIDNLAKLLHVSHPRAEHLASSCPDLVLRPSELLQDNMRNLLATLQLSTPACIDAILAAPHLLLLAPQQLQQHLEALAAPLGLPLRAVLASRDLKATLVKLHPQQVSDRVRMLARLTKMPAASAAPLALEAPALLTVSEQQLRRSISNLCTTLQVPVNALGHVLTHAPGLLVVRPNQLQATLAAVASVTRLDAPQAVALVHQEVALALVPAQVVGRVAAAVTASLQCTSGHTAELLRRCPAILLRGPGAVTTCAQLLVATFRLDPPALLLLVKYDPAILQESPGSLKAICQRFRQQASGSAAWQLQYEGLRAAPASLARALSFPAVSYERLAYLAATRLDDTITLRKALATPPADFDAAYPGFREWLRARDGGGPAAQRTGWSRRKWPRPTSSGSSRPRDG